jgi:hypothetical protein
MAFAALLGILVFGCMQDEPLQAPEPPVSALVFSVTNGTETLGPIDITLAAGTGIVAAGVGLREGQPDNIDINVPGAVQQVILYWEGQQLVSGGDPSIDINGNPVPGTLIGGPTHFYTNAWSSTYRADITSMGVVSTGPNSIAVSGMEFTRENNGAGIIVVYDDGSAPAEIQVVDGNDCCFYNFSDPLDRTEPQTFTFTSSIVPRTATLVMMASSVASNRPNVVRITVGAVTTEFVDIFHNLDGPEFDTSEISVDVPAGETSLTVQCFSEKHPSSVLTGIPASMCWMASSLAIVPEQPASLGDFVWDDYDEDGIQDSGEPGIPGVTVHLYKDCASVTPLLSTTTDSNGKYLFSNLEAGQYYVKFDLPAGYAFSPQDQGADDTVDSDADPSTGITICTTLDPGEDDMTWDAGMHVIPASLGDFVWDDLDEDGIQDPGELGIPGVTVYLYQGCMATQHIDFTTTDSNGEYLFDDLEPDYNYFVEFELPAGYVFSPKDQGADNTVDSDANPATGRTVCTLLDPGENDMTWDAGMHLILQPMGCRVTGGGVDRSGNWDGITYAEKEKNSPTDNRYQFGGQAGANTALPPQPKGEWTHHQQRGPYGSFTFHAGTSSAPEGTEIDEIVCNDPNNCKPARRAPAKQIDFWGVGTFKSVKHVPDIIKNNVIVHESLHWFEVNIDDLGEPGRGGKQDPPLASCPAEGFGLNGQPGDGDGKCECPDYYRITIYAGPTDASEIIYMVEGYINGGNLQIHPLTGYDRKPDAGDLGNR